MGWEAWFTLAVLGLALLALVRNLAGPDVILVGALTLLMTGAVFSDQLPGPAQLVAGFGNAGALTVAVLFIVSAGMTRSGATQRLTRPLLGQATPDQPLTPRRAQARIMGPVLALSAFLNNTPMVAMLLPAIGDWARKTGIAPSKLLIPLSYAAILGGMCTLIGTSTNLLIYGLLLEDGYSIGLFTVGAVGLPVALAGMAYILLLGPRFLPTRQRLLDTSDDAKQYTLEMVVDPDSPLAGQTIEQAGLRHLPGLYLAELQREDQVLPAVAPDTVLHEADRLVFVGRVDSVVDLRKQRGLSPADEQAQKVNAPHASRRFIEAVVSPSFPLVNRTIREGQFRNRYNAAVIAVARHGQRLEGKIGDITLHPGDTLLLEAPSGFVTDQRNRQDFYLVSALEDTAPPQHHKAPVAIAIVAAFVIAIAFRWLSPLHAALLAAGAMYVTRCLNAATARAAIDWSVMVVIGAALGIGIAVQQSGLAHTIADALLTTIGSNPILVLAAIYLLTNLFTELITNNAAAVLVYPIAKAAALSLGLDLTPFVVTIMIAASASFATPIGYQTNLMVYGPGGYRFTDFLKFGLPLNALVFLLTLLLTPLIWDLTPPALPV
ncbi:MAG: SLC13 family permease [Planctomycetota bacterium]